MDHHQHQFLQLDLINPPPKPIHPCLPKGQASSPPEQQPCSLKAKPPKEPLHQYLIIYQYSTLTPNLLQSAKLLESTIKPPNL
jgi:hypothetical protein